MKWLRFVYQGREYAGYQEDGFIHAVEGDMFSGNWTPVGLRAGLDDVMLLAPCKPSKIVCIGLNYRDHAEEMKLELPQEPLLFLKPPSSVIGPAEPIACPDWVGRVDYEAELAIVIGRRVKNVREEEAGDAIFGYTCANDVTARQLQKKDGQWSRAKSFDTFCPLGPWIVTGLDVTNIALSLILNGETRQESDTAQMVFGPRQLVAFVSRVMTLEAGDVILTGTPSGIGRIVPGDRVTVRIQGIGELTNTVV